MADIVDRATRSRMMSGIRGKNTKPELIVRSHLHRSGLRFRLHKNLPGRPDLVFPKYGAAVFVNGCFWHGHDCGAFRIPKTRSDFWEAKIMGNRARDARVNLELRRLGWRTFTVWECELRNQSDPNLSKTLNRLAARIRKPLRP